MGVGWTIAAIAAELHLNRKTITRWRTSDGEFGEASERVMELARDGTPTALAEIDQLVAAWTPPPRRLGLREAELREAELEVAGPEEPEVIGRDGRLVTRLAPGSGPSPRAHDDAYTTKRPPTAAEWLAEMAEIAKDPNEPERLRAVAMGCVSSALFGGPGMRVGVRQSDAGPSPAAEAAQEAARRERGRDAGVPARVWQEARQNFLGPAPEPSAAAGEREQREQVEPESSTA
jgi:hypothetical protein